MSKILTKLCLLVAVLYTVGTGTPSAAGPLATPSPQEAAPQEAAPQEEPAKDPIKENVATQQAQAFTEAVQGLLASKLGIPPWAAVLIAKGVIFVLVLVVFRVLASLLSNFLRQALLRSKLKPTKLFLEFVTGSTMKVVSLFGLLMGLSVLGVPLGPLLAGIGVLGFVIGFALQETLSNFASGVMILLYRPYDIGDFVSAGGVTGKVLSMNLVSTTISTPDNQLQIVPNNSIWGGVITNVTANTTRRVDLVAGIGYDDDLELAQRTLEGLVKAHELVLDDPAPVIQVSQLGDSSVNFIVRPWAKTTDYWTVYWDLTRAIKTEFDKEGITIPYPQRDVHLHTVE